MEDFDSKALDHNLIEIESFIEDSSIPQYVISGSGWGWFLDPELHQMVRVARGSEIIPMPVTHKEIADEKMLVRAAYRFLLIDSDEVHKIGWN